MIPPRVSVDVIRERIGKYADKEQSAEQRSAIYKELIGFVPPRIEARINVTGALDPKLLDLQERMRAQAMYPKCFDVKTAQLMLFGMLLMDMNDAAPLHELCAAVMKAAPGLHAMRDLTRGGLATSLCEIALTSNIGIEVYANSIPVREDVKGACETLGLDPLFVANEGTRCHRRDWRDCAGKEGAGLMEQWLLKQVENRLLTGAAQTSYRAATVREQTL